MDDFRRLKELVSSALDRPVDEREAWLVAHCADPAMLAEAQALIAHDDPRLEHAVEAGLAAEASRLLDRPARSVVIPGYEVLETMGAGGMGVIYRARQTGALEREVAIKLIRPGFDTAGVVARFEAERRTLARMEHPNIAQVFDAGATADGLPWFAMELVEGDPVNEWCDARELDLEARLRIFEGIGRGVQHAHQKGIIHRDLKPTNILVVERDGEAVPKIIDFGIAKALGDAAGAGLTLTVDGHVLGTPEYMSPERLASPDADADIRTDVYALGVLLYQLLTGTLPFDRATLARALHGETADPPRPSTRVTGPGARQRRIDAQTLRRRLRGDLDWIALKALAPRAADRYPTVQDLLNDIQRHRQGHPVSAGPPTVRYRMGKFVARHRVGIGVVATILVLLTTGLVETNRQRLRAESARDEADAVTDFLTEMLSSVRADEMGREVTVQQVLERASQSLDDELAGQPLVRARLLTTTGRTWIALGHADHALAALDEAVRLRGSSLGPRAPETLESRAHRGVALRDDGQLDAAIGEFEDVLALRREVLGPDHPLTLGTLNELGGALQQNGDREAARRAFEEAHEGFLRSGGPRDPDTIDAARNLGNFLAEAGEFDAADPLLTGALDASLEVFGPDHPETSSCYQSLALLRFDQGRPAECEELLSEVLAGRRRMHGDEHPQTLEAMINLASVRSSTGQLESAVELLEEALPRCRSGLGDEHRATLTCMNNLAWAYSELGRDDRAEPLLVETVETRRRVRGDTHLFTLISWNNLGELYLRTGRAGLAEQTHREVLGLRQQSLGAEHPHVMISMTNLASALREQERYDEAGRLYEDSWQKQERLLGPDHPDTRRTVDEALVLWEMAQRPAEVERWSARVSGDR